MDKKLFGLCPYHSLWTKERKTFAVAETWAGLEKHDIIVENYKKNFHY
jgi:hypothetical protein